MAELILELGRCKDRTGTTHNGVVFLSFIGKTRRGGRPYWLCLCPCGTEFKSLADAVVYGDTKSCGCKKLAHLRSITTKHSKSGSPEYQAWEGMKRRCLCPTERSYPNYGGRGIKVCERWQGDEGFVHFLSDMGDRPSPKHTLDRKDNDGDYEPGNCRWATWGEQSRNKRSNVVATFNGETMTATDWAKRIGISRDTLFWRLKHWAVERALTTPPGKSYRRSKHVATG